MDQAEALSLVKQAAVAVEYARATRAAHAKRTPKGSGARETDLRIALHKLREAMRPIRSEIARYKGGGGRDGELHALLLDASAVVQRERRKLWKMQTHRRRRKNQRPRKRMT